jgi:uncharacterized FlaG/YvyC family protein
MDSSSINPVKGPDIQTAKPSAPSAQPVTSPPKTEEKAAPNDTVSLSPAAKNALESSAPPDTAREASSPVASPEKVVQKADRPEIKSGDAGLENSRQLSLTDANDVVLKIVDNETREVIKQIPSEEELQLKSAIRNGVENIAPENNSTEELI